MPEFYMIFARKKYFSQILGAIPGYKSESEQIWVSNSGPYTQ